MTTMRPIRSRKYLGAVTALAAAALLAAGCSSGSGGGSGASGSGSPSTITLGVLAPLSGANQNGGLAELHGAQIAVDQINAAGGIKALGGAKLKLVSADSSSTSTSQAISAAQQLVADNPAAILGAVSSTLEIPASTVSEQKKIPSCVGALSDTLTSRGYKYLFQLPPTATQLAKNAVPNFLTFLKAYYPNITKVAVIYDSNPAETGTGQAFAKELSSMNTNVKVVLNKQYPLNFTDAAPLAAEIKSSGAEVIVPGSLASELELIIGALNSAGVSGLPIFNAGGGDATGELWVNELGKYANGQYVLPNFAAQANLGNAKNQLLAAANDAYVKDYKQPFMGQYAGEYYVCTQIIAQAIQNAKSADPTAIRDAIAGHTFATSAASLYPPGQVHFGPTGLNTDGTSVIAQFCQGKLNVVGPPAMATSKAQSTAACGGV